MQHIDLLFDIARTKNDIDIEIIVQKVRCFREFAKRFLFDSNIDVSAALDTINKVLSNLPSDTQEKIDAVRAITDVSEREALHRLVFCNMNADAAIENVYQDRAAMQIMQLVEGCTEDSAQAVLKHHNNNVNQAVDYLMSLKDDIYSGASGAAPVLSAEQQAQAFGRAVKRFMETTGEDDASARVWLQKYGGNNDMAIQQFLEFDETATKAGRIIIDATAATLGLQSIEVAGGRGHCFYLTVSQQLSLHGVYLTFQQLRAIAADDIAQEFQAGTSSVIYSIYSSIDPPCTKSFKDWCFSMAAGIRYSGPNPVWADNLSISSLLNGLFKNAIVVKLRIIASRQETAAARRILEIEPTGALLAAGPILTLTICHVYGRHYLGTTPIATSSHMLYNDDELPMFIDNPNETDVLPDISALRFLSDTATEQPRASSSQGQGSASLWSKYDKAASQREEVKLAKTTATKAPRKKRAAKVAKTPTAILPKMPAPVASTFAAAADTPIEAPIVSTFAAQDVTPFAAPIATVTETPHKKSKKRAAPPIWPGSIEQITDALSAHAEAWKKHSCYDRWLSEGKDNAANPDRCKTLFNHFEEKRLQLLKQIHATYCNESTKK